MDSQISARQRLSKHITTQTTIGETMMEYINTWLHSNIKSNDEKLLNYTNEACINSKLGEKPINILQKILFNGSSL
jgi:hemerythrin